MHITYKYIIVYCNGIYIQSGVQGATHKAQLLYLCYFKPPCMVHWYINGKMFLGMGNTRSVGGDILVRRKICNYLYALCFQECT